VAAETQTIDFGRVLEGSVVTKQVTIIAETRAPLTVGLSTQSPFATTPLLDIPGGSQAEVDVRFQAPNGVATGVLTITSRQQVAQVALRGEGVRPPTCTPSGPCMRSQYSLELDRCIEAPAPEQSPCDPGSACLEQGRCTGGQCLGVARRCDDNNLCTSDACAIDAGCVHTAVACPSPNKACFVATCDPRMGCGEAPAPDGTLCGATDCVMASVCSQGMCQRIPTPEGTECGPSIACYGPSRCSNQTCRRPDAGPWNPSWTARLDSLPNIDEPVLTVFGSAVFFSACGLPIEQTDAGMPDAAVSGHDAGHVETGCALLSYTSTGFERYRVSVDPSERIVHVGPAGVGLLTDGGYFLRSRTTGVPLASWSNDHLGPKQIATLADGGVLFAAPADGGTTLFRLVGNQVSEWAFGPVVTDALAVAENDDVWLRARDQLWRISSTPDGSLEFIEHIRSDAGAQALAVSMGSAVYGQTLVSLALDGGTNPTTLDVPPGATLDERSALMTPWTVFQFFKACQALLMSCVQADEVTWVRAYDRKTGVVLWHDALVPPRTAGRVINTSPIRLPGQAANALVTVVESTLDDGGVQNGLLLSLDGGRAGECPFPDGTGRLVGSVFSPGLLVTSSQRPDAAVVLEGWPLGGLPLETSGWPQAGGVSSQRRALP
jgi:hypothetical protein